MITHDGLFQGSKWVDGDIPCSGDSVGFGNVYSGWDQVGYEQLSVL